MTPEGLTNYDKGLPFDGHQLGQFHGAKTVGLSSSSACHHKVMRLKHMLVGGDWNMDFIFPYIGYNSTSWLSYFSEG